MFFSVKHVQFIFKNTFKVTYFGFTEPSSGLFVRTDPYPDDGSVKPKHVALIVFLTINWMCLTKKNLHFVYIQEHIGMTNVKLGAFLRS